MRRYKVKVERGRWLRWFWWRWAVVETEPDGTFVSADVGTCIGLRHAYLVAYDVRNQRVLDALLKAQLEEAEAWQHPLIEP